MKLFVDPVADYRPDIDGIRAIAVLSVIVFHIDKALLPGGFIGVDIFFVISGFLISRNIIGGIEGGNFSIVEFYRRRVKRIAPAMLAVIFPTLVLAQIVMLPEDAVFTAESALWATLSLSNVFFWLNLDTSYFAAASNEAPLLHLWSLGVEEQFYLIWPIFLTLVYRPGRSRFLFLFALSVALFSFMLAELVFEHDPAFAFYMLPTRIGELLLGALVAIVVLKGADRTIPDNLIRSMGWLGALIIFSSLGMLSEDDVFPGVRAIPPSFGTALIILAGHRRGDRIARLLAFKPLVGVGLVSYSAYLWHWPLLAFVRYGRSEITVVTAITVFSATLVLAWLTYRYVEQPARRAKAPARKIFLYQYIVPAGALALLSLCALQVDGYGIRYASENYRSELKEIRSQDPAAYAYEYVCQKTRILEQHLRDERCVLGPDSQSTTSVILWGDSTAAHYVGMLGAFANEAGFKFRNIAVATCPGIDGDPEPFVAARRLADCRASGESARPVIDRFDVVILSSSWTGYGKSPSTFLNASMNTARRLARKGLSRCPR